MRIKVDEDLPRAVVALFREAGHDAKTAREEGLGGAKDPLVWRTTQREGRLLITADKGFGDIRKYPPGTHAGVVLLRPVEDGIRPAVQLAEALLVQFSVDRLAGSITVVTPSGIRIRRSG